MSPRRERILSWSFGVLAVAALIYLVWPTAKPRGGRTGTTNAAQPRADAPAADAPGGQVPTSSTAGPVSGGPQAPGLPSPTAGSGEAFSMPARPPEEPPDYGLGGDPRLHPPPPEGELLTMKVEPGILRARQLVQILTLRELAEAGALESGEPGDDWSRLHELEAWAAQSNISDGEWAEAQVELGQRRATATSAPAPRHP